ncbi:hypothetical protein [Candidatus Manganitrophus noduliformans]|uniref:Uncharacterized protein n=1 Tax=Candidatus Manganitrophus noduliformans TaxID=2606439 RepID=A0A7X6DQA1_9BACT|nr:hypothetical protein [Candidatus Manganitrophus noduliformans]NKE71254.1 hypothetical protein [Candidatus Manganitrophus noduliformans]
MSKVMEKDPLIVSTSDLGPLKPGLTLVDAWKSQPRPNMSRSFFLGPTPNSQFRRDPNEFLCPGAAVGIDHDGILRHVHPSNRLKGFTGFLITNLEEGRALVTVRGRTLLKIEDLNRGDEHKKVYALGVNRFVLSPQAGAYEIGQIIFIQPDRVGIACVEFKSFDDPEPLDLRINNQ